MNDMTEHDDINVADLMPPADRSRHQGCGVEAGMSAIDMALMCPGVDPIPPKFTPPAAGSRMSLALMCLGVIPIAARPAATAATLPAVPSYDQFRAERQRKIFEFIKQRGTVTRRDVMDMNGTGKSVSQKDLEVLCDSGMIFRRRHGAIWVFRAEIGAERPEVRVNDRNN